jgi:hypothetical protein
MFAAIAGMATAADKTPSPGTWLHAAPFFDDTPKTQEIRRLRMIRNFAGAALVASVAFAAVPQFAFAANDADCAAEWAQADANKDGVIAGPEADRYIAYIRIRSQAAPQDGRITQDAFMAACKGDVFKAKAPDAGAPLKGANSFTESQAKDRAVAAGYTDIATLAKDDDGIWRGAAKKGPQSVNVAVDFKGNVVSQ